MAETTYNTLVGTKNSWGWDKCDYDLSEECPVGDKESWDWDVPSQGASTTRQGNKSSWDWDTT